MARPGWKRYAKPAVKALIAVAVVLAVGRYVEKTWRDVHKQGGSVHVDPAWLVVAGVLYLAGLTACGAFFSRILRDSPSPVPTFAAVRAYLISHLGKYVPGKAMVVVMRVGLVVPAGARAATAALATFYETLAMMGAGALVAALGFLLGPRPVPWVPVLLAAGLASALLAAVNPAVFPRAAGLVTLPFPGVGAGAMPRLSYRLLGEGVVLSGLGWVLLGLSQVAVVRALSTAGVPAGLWPLVIASVALATVAGFVVAVLPGGLGVREYVLMVTLDRALGTDRAVLAALVLRLTWVAAEVLAGAALAAFRPAVASRTAAPGVAAAANPGAPVP